MIHQNHLPLDQRREQARWKCAAIGGSPHFGLPLMPAIISGDPKRAGSAMGNPQDAQRSCIALHDTHLAVGAIQTLRALPHQQQRGRPSCQLAKEVRGFAKRLHTRDYCKRITVLFALYACQFPHQISVPLIL